MKSQGEAGVKEITAAETAFLTKAVTKTRKDGAAKVKGAEVQAKDEDRWPTP